MSGDGCAGCWFRRGVGHDSYCSYLLTVGRRRPCPGGDGCTVRMTEEEYLQSLKSKKMLRREERKGKIMESRRKIDQERAMELWLGGADDRALAREFGVTTSAVQQWRKKNGLVRAASAEASADGAEAAVCAEADAVDAAVGDAAEAVPGKADVPAADGAAAAEARAAAVDGAASAEPESMLFGKALVSGGTVVLRPSCDPAAIAAVRAYIEALGNSEDAVGLEQWLSRVPRLTVRDRARLDELGIAWVTRDTDSGYVRFWGPGAVALFPGGMYRGQSGADVPRAEDLGSLAARMFPLILPGEKVAVKSGLAETA